jgi:hypothetical protein
MKSKLINFWTIFIIIATLLAGCNSTPAMSTNTSSGLSPAAELAAGTLKLEGTAQAVTAKQAGALLTLWQAYQSLSSSDITSQVELDALMKQIQETMTTDQVRDIEAMRLTDQQVSELMQSMGAGASRPDAASTPNASGQSQTAPMGGPGGIPGGGDSVMNEINNGMVAQSTPAASQPATTTQTSGVNPILLITLIQLLELRSQTAG